jgi:hypothetical protein
LAENLSISKEATQAFIGMRLALIQRENKRKKEALLPKLCGASQTLLKDAV